MRVISAPHQYWRHSPWPPNLKDMHMHRSMRACACTHSHTLSLAHASLCFHHSIDHYQKGWCVCVCTCGLSFASLHYSSVSSMQKEALFALLSAISQSPEQYWHMAETPSVSVKWVINKWREYTWCQPPMVVRVQRGAYWKNYQSK